MDYRIEKRGAFQVVCKRKRVDKPAVWHSNARDLRYAAGIRRERHAERLIARLPAQRS